MAVDSHRAVVVVELDIVERLESAVQTTLPSVSSMTSARSLAGGPVADADGEIFRAVDHRSSSAPARDRGECRAPPNWKNFRLAGQLIAVEDDTRLAAARARLPRDQRVLAAVAESLRIARQTDRPVTGRWNRPP